MKRNKKIVVLLIVLTIISLVVYVVLRTEVFEKIFSMSICLLLVYLAVTHEKLEMKLSVLHGGSTQLTVLKFYRMTGSCSQDTLRRPCAGAGLKAVYYVPTGIISLHFSCIATI